MIRKCAFREERTSGVKRLGPNLEKSLGRRLTKNKSDFMMVILGFMKDALINDKPLRIE